MLELEPVGRHTIYVCTNLSCQLRGARDVLQAMSEATGAPVGGSSPDGLFHVRSFECLGACDLAPMASVAGHYRGPLDPEAAREIAAHLREGGAAVDVLPRKKLPESRAHGLQADRGVGGGS
jgi:NADH-quinone oxidoreductase subunit E